MNPWRGLAGLPRALWVLAGATLVNRSGTMFLPFLILYLTKDMGISPSAAGSPRARSRDASRTDSGRSG